MNYAEIVTEIQVAVLTRHNLDKSTDTYARVSAHEVGLRSLLAETPEHKMQQTGWRNQVEAARKKRRGRV